MSTYQELVQMYPFEVWDNIEDKGYFAETFTKALRIMRRYYDAKIIRLSDDVVLVQNQTGDSFDYNYD
jgi:hypothetical protein